MKSKYYMLKLKVCGIKNIESPIEILFYKKTINNDFDPTDYHVKAIYGENGSGKTAIIHAVKLLSKIIVDKNYLLNNDTQKSLLGIINKKLKGCFIETEFYESSESRKYIYKYYIALKVKYDNRVYIAEEKLEQKIGNYSRNHFHTIYHTCDAKLLSLQETDFFDNYYEKTQNLLDKQTFTSTLLDAFDEQNIDGELVVYEPITSAILFAVSIHVLLDVEDDSLTYSIRDKINTIDENSVNELEMNFINQIKQILPRTREDNKLVPKAIYPMYEAKVSRMFEFINIFKPELRDIEIEKKEREEYYECRLKMIYKDYDLDLDFESCGIKKLIDLFDYLDYASKGEIVFIDELDTSINDIFFDKIIEYFTYYGEGQLCFTAHNLSPMSILKENKYSISFISSVNTIHNWTNNGNLSPENAYRNGFIEDSPFNVDATDFLGILGGDND